MGMYLPYPKYKSSGDSWLGDIPEHWTSRRSDFVIDTNRQQVSAESLNGAEVIHYSIPNVQEFGAGIVERGEKIDSAKLLIREEQLLVSKLNPRKSTLCIAKPDDAYRVIASSEFVPILPGKANLRYAYYLWGSDKVTKLLSSMVQSVTRSHQRVNPTDILKLHWAWPTLDEQQTIASFLDFKTAQIDALIAKKIALLDKLAEKRTALISHAVTKGLDPSVPMKDSGVSWLGEIPADWTTKRLRFLTSMAGGMTPSTTNSYYWDGNTPWITPKDMKCEILSGSIDTLTEEALLETGITLHEAGRVLIVVRGMILAHTFPVAINTVPTTVNQDMKALSTSLDCEYLALLLRGIQPLILSVVEESAHGTKVLRTDIFKNIRLPVPPVESQKIIVKRITSLIANLDHQKEHIVSVIERLQEYRSALITNAVTGKIDVRSFSAPLTAVELAR